jgi:hypothetical protein
MSRVRGRLWVSVFVTLVLVCGGGTAATALTAGNAAAIGTVHKQHPDSFNQSDAVEGSVRVTFQCNDATGRYKIVVSGVQIIHEDGLTRWETLGLVWFLSRVGGSSIEETLALSQNSTSGLFGGSKTGTLSDVSVCATGANVKVIDADFGEVYLDGAALEYDVSLT